MFIVFYGDLLTSYPKSRIATNIKLILLFVLFRKAQILLQNTPTCYSDKFKLDYRYGQIYYFTKQGFNIKP